MVGGRFMGERLARATAETAIVVDRRIPPAARPRARGSRASVQDGDVLGLEPVAQAVHEVVVQADLPGLAELQVAGRGAIRVADGDGAAAAAIRSEHFQKPLGGARSIAREAQSAREFLA